MDFLSEKFDIIIQGGQSNAEGYGIGPVEKEYTPNSKIVYLTDRRNVEVLTKGVRFSEEDKRFFIQEASEHFGVGGICGDFSLTFAEKYIKNGLLEKGRKLLIVRAAVGGTGFVTQQWGLQNDLYVRMLEMINYTLSCGSENKIVAFLWHQGETDAIEGNTKEIYHEQLTAILNDVRLRYGNIPFIAGDFVNEWKSHNMEIAQPIVEALRQVIQESENAAFIETSDLPSNNQKIQNGDEIHFCRQSLHELGVRYFEAFQNLKNN